VDVATQNERGLQYEPEVNYHRAWAAFSRRHHTAIFLLFSWPVVAGGVFTLSGLWINQPVLALTISVVWLLLALAAVWWAGEFRCPRCRRRYAALGHKSGSTNLTRGLFDQVCSNCKLRKFEHGERREHGSSRPFGLTSTQIAEQRAAIAQDVEIAGLESSEPPAESNAVAAAPQPLAVEAPPVASVLEEPAGPPPETPPAATEASGTETAKVTAPKKAVRVKSKSSAKRRPRKAKE
jgi:hypothetical protein